MPLSPASTAEEVVAYLQSIGSEQTREGMKRFGIRVDRALGISHGVQRDIAKRIRRNDERAFALWRTGIAEAQFIASLTVHPKHFTIENARDWARDFDSWDIVDSVSDLFASTDGWKTLVEEFAADEREFIRRTAFAMICWAAVHRKAEPDATFEAYLPLIEQHARDDRNFVKKAVNWALRNIGKRSIALHALALEVARKLSALDDATARWIGKDAVRELTHPKTLGQLATKAERAVESRGLRP